MTKFGILPKTVTNNFNLSFSGGFGQYRLEQSVLQSIEKLGWKKPTDVQFYTIPCALMNNNLIVSALAGTGKTGAYAIPIANEILTLSNLPPVMSEYRGYFFYRPNYLILVPTSELVTQVVDCFRNFREKKFVIGLGGEKCYKEELILMKRCFDTRIVVATPNHLIKHFQLYDIMINYAKKKEDHREFDRALCAFLDLGKLRTLVIDEADRLMSPTHLEHMNNVKSHIQKLNKKYTTMIFSATFPPHVHGILDSFAPNHILLDLNAGMKVPSNIKLFFLKVFSNKTKPQLFKHLFSTTNPDLCLKGKRIFCFIQKVEFAEPFQQVLKELGLPHHFVYADLPPAKRKMILKEFEQGIVNIVIGTDLLGRGVDYPDIDVVLNLNVPMTSNEFVHRVGRCGRAGKAGTAITMVAEQPFDVTVVGKQAIVCEMRYIHDLSINLARSFKFTHLPEFEKDHTPPNLLSLVVNNPKLSNKVRRKVKLTLKQQEEFGLSEKSSFTKTEILEKMKKNIARKKTTHLPFAEDLLAKVTMKQEGEQKKIFFNTQSSFAIRKRAFRKKLEKKGIKKPGEETVNLLYS